MLPWPSVLGHFHAGIPIHFQCPGLTVHCPVHHPFDAVQLSCPLSRKTPPNHNVSTSMFDGRDGVLEVIGSIRPPNTAS